MSETWLLKLFKTYISGNLFLAKVNSKHDFPHKLSPTITSFLEIIAMFGERDRERERERGGGGGEGEGEIKVAEWLGSDRSSSSAVRSTQQSRRQLTSHVNLFAT